MGIKSSRNNNKFRFKFIHYRQQLFYKDLQKLCISSTFLHIDIKRITQPIINPFFFWSAGLWIKWMLMNAKIKNSRIVIKYILCAIPMMNIKVNYEYVL